MKGSPTGPWGKLEKSEAGEVLAWHPLEAHCADVAACTEALLRTTIIGGRLARLAGVEQLTEVSIQRYCFLALLHDGGKYNHGFQRKADREPRDFAGHVKELASGLILKSGVTDAIREVLRWKELGGWSDDGRAIRLLLASIGHHGKPVSFEEASVFRYDYWKPVAAYDPVAGLAALVEKGCEWFPRAFEEGETLPANPELQHAFAGLVTLADWLGSDKKSFSYAEELSDRMPFARQKAQEVLRQIGLDPRASRESLGAQPVSFALVSDFPPHPAQQATVNLPFRSEGSLTILESETGSGKTEAALARFAQMFQQGLVDGMTFALPTRTAATQIHDRVFAAIKGAFPDAGARPPVILAVPGYMQVDDTKGQILSGFQVLWAGDDSESERRRYRGWAAENSKRYLAGAIVVGTIDQVLLSTLEVSHSHMRSTSLLRHLLVVDEVHASDAYMTAILQQVLKFHFRAGGHAFLMSATLGSESRARFQGIGGLSLPSFDDSLESPYPALHDGTVGEAFVHPHIEAPRSQKRIEVVVGPLAASFESVVSRALEAARRGARVIVLRNTVADALRTQEALEAAAGLADQRILFRVNGHATMHHSRFAREDRKALDEALVERVGKSAPNTGGFLLVATQTVEQSLDLDADFMITDLAPMDVLLQRFGRLHRHTERNDFRPTGFEIPRAIVLTSEEPLGEWIQSNGEVRGGQHGAGSVYENLLILEATRRLLTEREALTIPAENRDLVERSLHSEVLGQLAQEMGENWQAHQAAIWGVLLGQKQHAEMNCVDRSKEFGEFQFGSELSEKIKTRLGDDPFTIQFERPVMSPLGNEISEISVPGWMLKGAELPKELLPVAVEVAGNEGGTISFKFAEKSFEYKRLGYQVVEAG